MDSTATIAWATHVCSRNMSPALTVRKRDATFPGVIGYNLLINMIRLSNIRACRISRCGALTAAIVTCGCSANSQTASNTVSAAWHSPRIETTAADSPANPAPKPTGIGDESAPATIATVNGQAIPLTRLHELLMRSRGSVVLEQLIGLETATMAAEERGLSVNQTDVDREHDRALRQLVDPLSSITPGAFDRVRAEQLLDTVLNQRSVSREEFRLVMRRNAYLRKIVERDLKLTTDAVRREAERLYGRRAVVRHIQLTSLAAVNQATEALAAGKSFEDLARRHSANSASAARGGLLEPFSQEDELVPGAFREVAFSLTPGGVSGPVRVGEWYHLIALQRFVAAEDVDFEQVRSKVEQILRERTADQTMFAVFEKLFQQATIEINDPALKAAFDRRRAVNDR